MPWFSSENRIKHYSRINTSCGICSGNYRIDQEIINNNAAKFGFEVLEEYTGYNKKLKVKCSAGHVIDMTYSAIIEGIRCAKCFGNARKEIEEVRDYINNTGYKLLSTEYINANSKLEMECDKHHIIKIAWHNFQRGKRCGVCSKENNISEGYVREYLKEITEDSWESYNPKWLRRYKKGLPCEIDCYSEIYNAAIEVQGRQHIEYPNLFHSKYKDFEAQQERDKFKKEKILERGIIFIEIRALDYYQCKDDMLKALEDLLIENNIIKEEQRKYKIKKD